VNPPEKFSTYRFALAISARVQNDESGYLHPNRLELRNQYNVRHKYTSKKMSIVTRTLLAIILAGAGGTLALSASAPVRPSAEKSDSLLTSLEKRCRKMLEMQMAVFEGTKSLHKTIQANANKKPRPEDRLRAFSLATKQQAIVIEATTAQNMLRLGVAFSEVFDQVHADIKHVHARLQECDVGIKTQAIQKDIIDSLDEMTSAIRCPKKTTGS
jgi:hypothetical protein